MLTIASAGDLEEIKNFCRNNPFGAYISCRAVAYGFETGFSKLWCGRSKNDELVSVVSSLGGNAVILAKDGCDNEELSFMISAFSMNSVLTDYDTGTKCFSKRFQKKEIFRFDGCDFKVNEIESEPEMKDVYSLFLSCFPESYQADKDSYLSWLSDFVFRKNRSLARIKAVVLDGKVLSAALTSAESEDCAVISSVACNEKCRNNGYGKAVLLSLVNELKAEGKNVFVISENRSVSEFYKKSGFKNCGFAAYTERHNNV